MKRRWKRWRITLLVVAIVGFISYNTYLIVTEKEKIARTVYVSDWTTVKQGDVIESFETNGVIVPSDETPIYYDKSEKEFLRFLVKEGDMIEEGTPLFEYANPNIEKEKQMVELEIQQIEGQIDEIKKHIVTLSTERPGIPVFRNTEENLEDYVNIADHVSQTLFNQSIQQQINEQELEVSKLEKKLEAYEQQLNYLNEQESFVTIVSETDGIVTEIDEQLINPIVTIASSEYVVEGMLNEEQAEHADTGMRIETMMDEEILEGNIEQINTYPEEEPTLETENYYRFRASLEGAENLKIGTKTALSVITNEAIGVPTVPEEAIQEEAVYVLNENGKIVMQPTTLGLTSDGIQELKTGVNAGDVVAIGVTNDAGGNANFVTDLKASKLKPSLLKYIPKQERWKYFFLGFK